MDVWSLVYSPCCIPLIQVDAATAPTALIAEDDKVKAATAGSDLVELCNLDMGQNERIGDEQADSSSRDVLKWVKVNYSACCGLRVRPPLTSALHEFTSSGGRGIQLHSVGHQVSPLLVALANHQWFHNRVHCCDEDGNATVGRPVREPCTFVLPECFHGLCKWYGNGDGGR